MRGFQFFEYGNSTQFSEKLKAFVAEKLKSLDVNPSEYQIRYGRPDERTERNLFLKAIEEQPENPDRKMEFARWLSEDIEKQEPSEKRLNVAFRWCAVNGKHPTKCQNQDGGFDYFWRREENGLTGSEYLPDSIYSLFSGYDQANTGRELLEDSFRLLADALVKRHELGLQYPTA